MTAMARSTYRLIDAISMNQQDVIEKSSQADVTSQIYDRANSALSWDGDTHVASQVAKVALIHSEAAHLKLKDRFGNRDYKNSM